MLRKTLKHVFFFHKDGDVASKRMVPMARLDDPMMDPRVF